MLLLSSWAADDMRAERYYSSPPSPSVPNVRVGSCLNCPPKMMACSFRSANGKGNAASDGSKVFMLSVLLVNGATSIAAKKM